MNQGDRILSALKKGECGAFKMFFSEYYDVLVLFASGILKDTCVAEDLVQDCFADMWEKRLFMQISGNLDGYMFHMVRNASLNKIREEQRRKVRYEKVVSEVTEDGEIKDNDDAQEKTRMLYAAINELPLERRRIFMMVCAEGMTYQKTADQLGVSINTVRTQMCRSVKFLREKLKNRDFSSLLCFWVKVIKHRFSR